MRGKGEWNWVAGHSCPTDPFSASLSPSFFLSFSSFSLALNVPPVTGSSTALSLSLSLSLFPLSILLPLLGAKGKMASLSLLFLSLSLSDRKKQDREGERKKGRKGLLARKMCLTLLKPVFFFFLSLLSLCLFSLSLPILGLNQSRVFEGKREGAESSSPSLSASVSLLLSPRQFLPLTPQSLSSSSSPSSSSSLRHFLSQELFLFTLFRNSFFGSPFSLTFVLSLPLFLPWVEKKEVKRKREGSILRHQVSLFFLSDNNNIIWKKYFYFFSSHFKKKTWRERRRTSVKKNLLSLSFFCFTNRIRSREEEKDTDSKRFEREKKEERQRRIIKCCATEERKRKTKEIHETFTFASVSLFLTHSLGSSLITFIQFLIRNHQSIRSLVSTSFI